LLPFDPGTVAITVSKHFRNTWMRKWGWDHHDLREALRASYRASRIGKGKWELYVRKKGEKKLVMVYDVASNELFVITGAEG